MWLSAEYFIGLLSLIQGLHFSDALDIDTHSNPCIAKILSCDWYRRPFSLYKEKDIGMFTNIEDLNKACKEQAAYMRCIVRAENFCEQSIFLPMVEEMIKSRRFPAEICRPASPWQQLYLKEASCLNVYSREAFVHCVDKMNPDNALNPDSAFERRCKYGRAIIDCSATALQEKCGYYAGNIFKKFLKFHSLSEYKCFEFTPENVEYNSFSSTPGYDITEAIFNVLEPAVFDEDIDNKATEGASVKSDVDGTKVDHLESQISSDDSISDDTFNTFEFSNPLADEFLTTEFSLSGTLDSDAKSQDMFTEPDKFEFPALPKHHYIHKNRTTFALYEDLEMGHMKYMGCGEADVFWVILSPLKSKYCILTDLKSEYSEAIFKCTVRIDAPCSPELDDEDRSKKAEVFHRRYVATVLTPPNNQRLEDMAVMNVHYLKFYPYPTYITEKKVNLWTNEANSANIEQTESVSRKGSLESEDDRVEILYQRGNGSGQKWDKDTMNSPNHLDEDEYYEENENLDYYPEEEEDDDYFPELLTNNIIYIEDDKGALISLHDHRSPIYSKSVYQPHSLFRPRTGATFASNDPQHFDEVGTNQKGIIVQKSIFKEKVSEFQDEDIVSKVKSDKQEYCSAEAPCGGNSEFISGFGIKPGMHILSRTIETFDQLKDTSRLHQKIPSFTKLNENIDLKSFLISTEVYVVTPSSEIEVKKSTESSKTKLYEDEFVGDRCGYPPEDEFCTDSSIYSPVEDERLTTTTATVRSIYSSEEDEGFTTVSSIYSPEEEEKPITTIHSSYPHKKEIYVRDIVRDFPYLDTDYSSSEKNAPKSSDSKIDYLAPSNEHYIHAFTQPPYKYLYKHSDSEVNREDTIDPKNLKAQSSSEIESLWEKYLTDIKNVSKTLLKTEKSTNGELLDEVFITLLERAKSIFNLLVYSYAKNGLGLKDY